jgi:pimeloyl-ACP methyl ester carboxylesterase
VPTLTVPGAELWYEVDGEGPLVGYSHGLLFSSGAERRTGLFDWSPVAAAGRRLLRYDARGHGRSTGRPDPADYTWAHLAGDLLAVLDSQAPEGSQPRAAGRPESNRVSWAGTSMGCGTLLHAALRAPDRFDRLILAIPPTAWATRPAQAVLYRSGAEFIERNGGPAWLSAMEQLPQPEIFAGLLDGFAPDADLDLLPWILRGAADSDLPEPSALGALRMPVLILAWDTDPGHPVSTAQRLAEVLPDARLHVSTTWADVGTWGERAAQFLMTE